MITVHSTRFASMGTAKTHVNLDRRVAATQHARPWRTRLLAAVPPEHRETHTAHAYLPSAIITKTATIHSSVTV